MSTNDIKKFIKNITKNKYKEEVFLRLLQLDDNSIDKDRISYENYLREKHRKELQKISKLTENIPNNVSNKVICGSKFVNNDIKPVGKKYKYFINPVLSQKDNQQLNQTTDKSILSDIQSTNNTENLYKYNWKFYNKQFLKNKYINNNSFYVAPRDIPLDENGNPIIYNIDVKTFNAIKQKYPNYNENILKKNINVIYHNEFINETNVAKREKEIGDYLAELGNDVFLEGNYSKITYLRNITENIVFKQYSSINKNIIKANIFFYKLAFSLNIKEDELHDFSSLINIAFDEEERFDLISLYNSLC